MCTYAACRRAQWQWGLPALNRVKEATLIYSYLLISLIKAARLRYRSVFFWVKQMEALETRYAAMRGAA